ncbi:hypothetical protein [Lentzea sp. HUAS12]|uniref:hypothetical protein n=1 Tax=Lentzea sp. HUAS12 TaxID=2951806 RepID=UPI00209FF308|nr:hypothetical protein [Lentzea sp. HUAS12]USX56453.1 hypothetical protein ND450_20830 [Lentzea sp. HUAS12]
MKIKPEPGPPHTAAFDSVTTLLRDEMNKSAHQEPSPRRALRLEVDERADFGPKQIFSAAVRRQKDSSKTGSYVAAPNEKVPATAEGAQSATTS